MKTCNGVVVVYAWKRKGEEVGIISFHTLAFSNKKDTCSHTHTQYAGKKKEDTIAGELYCSFILSKRDARGRRMRMGNSVGVVKVRF